MSKPIVIEKQGRGYVVYVNGEPIVKVEGPKGPSLTWKGRPGFVATAAKMVFATKDRARSTAHQVGRYVLKLGDFVDTYTDYRDAKTSPTPARDGSLPIMGMRRPSTTSGSKASETVVVAHEHREKFIDEDALHELELYLDNTSELYGQKKAILANLAKRIKNKTYDESKAWRLWLFWVDAGAKRYAKEFKLLDAWNLTFTPALREALAKRIAKREHVELAAAVKAVGEKKRAKPKPAKAKETAAAEGGGTCAPFMKITRDVARYKKCLAHAKSIGPIEDAEAIYRLIGPELAKEDQEVFLVVLCDLRGNLRGVAEIARGQRSGVTVSIIDILRPVIAAGPAFFAVVHNHPSGVAKPSADDHDLTAQIKTACKALGDEARMVDHVVVGMGEFYSFENRKLYKVKADKGK